MRMMVVRIVLVRVVAVRVVPVRVVAVRLSGKPGENFVSGRDIIYTHGIDYAKRFPHTCIVAVREVAVTGQTNTKQRKTKHAVKNDRNIGNNKNIGGLFGDLPFLTLLASAAWTVDVIMVQPALRVRVPPLSFPTRVVALLPAQQPFQRQRVVTGIQPGIQQPSQQV